MKECESERELRPFEGHNSSHQALCQAARTQHGQGAQVIAHHRVIITHIAPVTGIPRLCSPVLYIQFCPHSLRSLEHRFLPCPAMLIADKLAKVVFQSYAVPCMCAGMCLVSLFSSLSTKSVSVHPSIYSFQHPSIFISIHPSTRLHILSSSLILFFFLFLSENIYSIYLLVSGVSHGH